MEQEYIESTLELIDFIADSPSCYHAVNNAAEMLDNAGFVRLDEKKRYKIECGKSYYVCRNSSSLIAFRIPEKEATGYNLVTSHTDSPSFKVKENPEISSVKAYTTLNVEVYGGAILAPWFDRPLSVAGRAFVKTSKGVQERLVNVDKDFCQIVNLCIHHNREVNKGHEYNVQKELLPIISNCESKGAMRKLVADTLEVEESKLLDYELFLYNRMTGSVWGLNDEFFSAPKIDDLMCAFCSIKAIISSELTDKILIAGLFDNEEVGSLSKQGACSDFLIQTVGRVSESLGYDYQKQCTMQANSFMLSADNGHAIHPNYTEKCDPTNHPVINGGVVIKYSGNQKYTTDGYSASYLKNILKGKDIPYQLYFNNSNIVGGSTLGNLSQAQFSVPTADIGAAQFAMHSPYETAGTKDTLTMTECMKAVFES